jgi:hypothetical protein
METSGYDEQVHTALTKFRTQNGPEPAHDALSVLSKLLENSLGNPNDPRFRQLKKTNAALQRRLLSANGIY